MDASTPSRPHHRFLSPRLTPTPHRPVLFRQVDVSHGRFNAILYCNRAAAHGRQPSLLDQALSDCNMAIALDTGYAKAYLRRAELRLRSGKRHLAVEDFGLAKRHDTAGAIGAEATRRMAELRTPNPAGAGAPQYRAGGFPGGSVPPQYAGGRGAAGRSGAGGGYSRPPPPPAPPRERCHYEVLGIAVSAPAAEVKKAYRRMALKHHPDKNNEDEAQRAAAQALFVEVQRSYEVLACPAARSRYDAERARRTRTGCFGPGTGSFGPGAGNYGYGADLDADDLFGGFYRQRSGYNRR